MASLAASAVDLYPTAATGGGEWFPAGKGSRNVIGRRLKLTLTGQGGATNTIPAAALGFKTLYFANDLWDSQNSKGYPTTIDPVNNILILLDGAAAPAPVDVTSTGAYVTVIGEPTLSIN